VRVEIDSVLSIFHTFSDELFVPEFSCKQNESLILCEINRVGGYVIESDGNDDEHENENGNENESESESDENDQDVEQPDDAEQVDDVEKADEMGEVTFSIYAHSDSKCKVLGSTTGTVQKNDVLVIHFHEDQLLWKSSGEDNQTQECDVSICSVYGICQSLAITKTKIMEDEDLVNELEKEYEIAHPPAADEDEENVDSYGVIHGHHNDQSDDDLDERIDEDEDEDDNHDLDHQHDHHSDHKHESNDHHHHSDHKHESNDHHHHRQDSDSDDSDDGMMIFSIFVSVVCTIILAVLVVMLVRKHKEKREREKRLSDLQRYNRNMGSIMGQHQPIVFQTYDDHRAYQLKKAACASSINQVREFH
jgi:hypothetical protein